MRDKFVTVIIVAAGISARMNGIDKCFHEILGKEIWCYSAEVFEKHPLIDEIVIVTRSDKLDYIRNMSERIGIRKLSSVVSGGSTRHESVTNGVLKTSKKTTHIAIHDAGRPLIDFKTISEAVELCLEVEAVCVAVPVKDTIKSSADGKTVDTTHKRSELYAMQTPQVFKKDLWLKGSSLIENPTDDGQLIEALGNKLYLSEGSYKNIKITTSEDLIIAKAFLEEDKSI